MMPARHMAQLAELTRPYREKRAKALRAIGTGRRRMAWAKFGSSLEGPESDRKSPHDPELRGGRWHLCRARGHEERFDRVAKCETENVLEVECTYCGRASHKPVRCRVALLCVSCRGKIAQEKIAKLSRNRRTAIDLCAKGGLFRRIRKGGAWSEKLVTMTAPHFAELGIKERILFLRTAWSCFSPLWADYWAGKRDVDGLKLRIPVARDGQKQKDTRGLRLVRWYRNVEWTPAEKCECGHDRSRHGPDSGPCRGCGPSSGCRGYRRSRVQDPDATKGHPHIHMWFLGPYLQGAKASESGERRNVVQNLWRFALEAAAWKKDEDGSLRFPTLSRLVATKEAGPRARVTRLRRELLPHVALKCAAPIVDVRRCKPGPSSLKEVIKYLFKDMVGTAQGGHERLSPAVWAAVFESFDSTRTTQGSRGLMSLAAFSEKVEVYNEVTGVVTELTGACCTKCSQRGYFWVRRRLMTQAEQAAIKEKREGRRLAKARDPAAQERLVGCG